MKIHGLQKTTLLDYPGKVACIVFTAGCNFRCPFCHNAPLVTSIDDKAAYSEDEILGFLEKRKSLLDGVSISGGEPLLTDDIKDFLIKVKKLGYSIKLDTNGSFPDRLADIVDSGLVNYVAMDVKNSFSKYSLTIGADVKVLPDIEKSIDFLISGTVDYEFRTTVANELHTVRDIEYIAKRISGAKRYFIQPFNDSGNLVGSLILTPPSAEILEEMKKTAQKYIDHVELRGI